jgi:hypothetical protein
MVFLDVEKAFDSVWHEGLLHKLVISTCYLYLTKMIAYFFSAAASFTSLRMILQSLFPAATPLFSFHVFQAVEDKNKRGQDPGNILHPMLVSNDSKHR